MHGSRLKASGTCDFLKNRYGKGYQISLSPKKPCIDNETSQISLDCTVEGMKNYQDALKDWALKCLPGSNFVSSIGK